MCSQAEKSWHVFGEPRLLFYFSRLVSHYLATPVSLSPHDASPGANTNSDCWHGPWRRPWRRVSARNAGEGPFEVLTSFLTQGPFGGIPLLEALRRGRRGGPTGHRAEPGSGSRVQRDYKYGQRSFLHRGFALLLLGNLFKDNRCKCLHFKRKRQTLYRTLTPDNCCFTEGFRL